MDYYDSENFLYINIYNILSDNEFVYEMNR